MIRIDLAGFESTIAAERSVVEDEDDDDEDDDDEDDYFKSSILILDHHGITQYPYLLDFDFNYVTCSEISWWAQVSAYAARRPGQNNRSGQQRGATAQELNQSGHIKDQVAGICILSFFSIHSGLKM